MRKAMEGIVWRITWHVLSLRETWSHIIQLLFDEQLHYQQGGKQSKEAQHQVHASIGKESTNLTGEMSGLRLGPWMIAQWNRWRPTRLTMEIGSEIEQSPRFENQTNQTGFLDPTVSIPKYFLCGRCVRIVFFFFCCNKSTSEVDFQLKPTDPPVSI